MAVVVNAGDSAACRKSFTRVTQEYEEDLDKKGRAETQVDLGVDDPEGAEVGHSCSCYKGFDKWPPDGDVPVRNTGWQVCQGTPATTE